MPLLFVLSELFIPWLSILPRTSGAPLSLAPTEPLAPILWEWLGQNGRGVGVSLVRAAMPFLSCSVYPPPQAGF